MQENCGADAPDISEERFARAEIDGVLDILKRRYSRGEMDIETFVEMCSRLDVSEQVLGKSPEAETSAR